jgi:periplasmic protein CpxP/Spy
MNKLTQRFLATSAAVLLVGASAAAMARGNGGCDGAPDGPRAEKMQQRMAEQHSQRQAQLKAKLKLTPEQEASWNQFAQATQPMAHGGMGANRPQLADMAKLTTPERIDAMQAMKAQRDAHMTHMAEATKAFYATLTAEQKVVFDAETAHQGMGRHSNGSPGKGHMGMNKG